MSSLGSGCYSSELVLSIEAGPEERLKREVRGLGSGDGAVTTSAAHKAAGGRIPGTFAP